MPTKISLYPIYGVADAVDDQPFDASVLPFDVVRGVTVENVTAMFNEDTFKWVRKEMGRHDLEDLQGVRYALTHRYANPQPGDGSPEDTQSERLVRYLAACLRLVRPMRQRASYLRGELSDNGTIDVRHFEHPVNLIEVPEVQKLFHLKNTDLDVFRAIAGDFLRAVEGNFWKFRMAVEFHDRGHFEDAYWKARYLLWCSAIEAIYTSHDWEHQGSRVAKERIKWFLIENTLIYEEGDIPNYVQPQPHTTVADVVDDIYNVRNFIAHGDRIPDEYFQRTGRHGINGELNILVVLNEAVSFIVRKSLVRILRENLLDHFACAGAAETYFALAGLTRSQIRQRQRRQGESDEQE